MESNRARDTQSVVHREHEGGGDARRQGEGRDVVGVIEERAKRRVEGGVVTRAGGDLGVSGLNILWDRPQDANGVAGGRPVQPRSKPTTGQPTLPTAEQGVW